MLHAWQQDLPRRMDPSTGAAQAVRGATAMKRVIKALRIAFDGITLVAVAVMVYLFIKLCTGNIDGMG